MYTNLKNTISDILYVSKITQTKNKKLVIIFSVVLSQMIAYSDIAIIMFFTSLFSETNLLPETLSRYEYLFDLKLILPTIILFRYYFQYLQSIILKKLEFDIQKNLKLYLLNEVFENRNFSTADTFFYVNTLSVHISYFYTSISNFLNYVLQTLAFTLYLFATEPSTISAFLVGILFLIYPIYILIKKSRQYEKQIYEKGQETNRDIQRVLDNSFLIKLLKKESDESDRYASIITKLYNDLVSKHKVNLLNSYLPPFSTVFLISIIALYFDNFFNITLSFMGVTLRMFQSLAMVSSQFNNIVNSQVHLENFYKMEKFKNNSFKENYILQKNDTDGSAIKLENVDFKYLNSDVNIFTNVNLDILKGKHTAFTGVNGSGKSTLLGILAGVYYPVKGKTISSSDKLGFVGPNPLIFEGTLLENIRYGNKKNIDEKIIINIVKQFELFEDKELIDLEMKVSNTTLSSGQMQKIAFIRVLLSDVDILFLDESTSNLDEKTKSLIFKILKDENYTIINSTHDLESFDFIDVHYKVEIIGKKRKLKKII